MILNKKQIELGYLGLYLLRSRLTGKRKDIKKSLLELKRHVLDSRIVINEHTKIKKYSVKSGYKIWSQSYDNMMNLLINTEQSIMEKLLTKYNGNVILDAACGTGRISKILVKQRRQVIGVDVSSDMLRLAKRKISGGKFINGSIEKIPLKDNEVDLTICSLALTHLKSINRAIRELKRVTKSEGIIILTDIHPTFVLIGGQAEFYGLNGEVGYVENNIHLISTYLKVFQKSELTVKDCIEIPFNIKPSAVKKIGLDLDYGITAQAMHGIPLVLIWILKKIN